MKKSGIFVLFFAFVLSVVLFPYPETLPANAEENIFTSGIEYHSSARSAVLMESTTGRILYNKNMDAKLPMASTTKIVTAITVLENCLDLDSKITIDNRAVGVEGTSIYLQPGEQLTIRELLYGLMLRSGNDASVALACAVGGDVPTFCSMMNALAHRLGASESNFVNPHGLDAENHYTTAHDLAIITAYALENPNFLEIVSAKTKTIRDGEENRRYLANKNRLLASLDGCIGVKTGFTSKAGRCLVSACEREGLRLVSVVFNCGPMFEESAEMFEAAFKKFRMVEVLPAYHYIRSVPVENGSNAYVSVFSKEGFSLPLTAEEESNLSVVFEIPESLKAPVKKEQNVGKVQIYYGKHLLFSGKTYTMEEVDSKLLKDKVKDILENWNA